MIDDDKRRRNSLLATLLVMHDGSAPARVLRADMENVHGIAVTLDKIRADLRVLADIGALQLNGDLAQITAEGREHVQKLRELF